MGCILPVPLIVLAFYPRNRLHAEGRYTRPTHCESGTKSAWLPGSISDELVQFFQNDLLSG